MRRAERDLEGGKVEINGVAKIHCSMPRSAKCPRMVRRMTGDATPPHHSLHPSPRLHSLSSTVGPLAEPSQRRGGGSQG